MFRRAINSQALSLERKTASECLSYILTGYTLFDCSPRIASPTTSQRSERNDPEAVSALDCTFTDVVDGWNLRGVQPFAA